MTMNIFVVVLLALMGWSLISVLASVTVGAVAAGRDDRIVPVDPHSGAAAAAHRARLAS
jgi:hypothetical protein